MCAACCWQAFEHSAPAEVVVEISGGDAVEPAHPLLEPTIVGIDVLDIENTLSDPFAGGRMTSDDGVMLLGAVERRIGIARSLAALIADPRNPANPQRPPDMF